MVSNTGLISTQPGGASTLLPSSGHTSVTSLTESYRWCDNDDSSGGLLCGSSRQNYKKLLFTGDIDPSGGLHESYRRHVTSLDQTVLGEELMTTMAALRRLVRRRLRSVVAGPPLRGAQVELLQVIEKQPGIGIAPAGRALHLAANSVSTLVNQLIDLGMLVRQTDPDDRRAARLWVTEAATQRLAAWRQARIDFLAGGVSGLPIADREALARALPALRALLVALDASEGG
jgi:DNA-binding MarR family transcriptional regulator